LDVLKSFFLKISKSYSYLFCFCKYCFVFILYEKVPHIMYSLRRYRYIPLPNSTDTLLLWAPSSRLESAALWARLISSHHKKTTSLWLLVLLWLLLAGRTASGNSSNICLPVWCCWLLLTAITLMTRRPQRIYAQFSTVLQLLQLQLHLKCREVVQAVR